jgi:aminoglycoside 2''-phosphotransferase
MPPDWRRIQAKNPGFTVESASPLGEGWNSRLFLVNGEWVLKFPKRPEDWAELEREVRFLTLAAEHLPLRVPRYARAVPYSAAAPCGYAMYRYLPGYPMDESALSRGNRLAAAEAVASFLLAMHRLQIDPELAALLPREDWHAAGETYRERAEHSLPRFSTPILAGTTS